MLAIFRRFEDVLVQVVRLVLLAFSLVILIGLALWIWESWNGKKETSTTETTQLNWKDAKLDLGFVVAETGRDLGNTASQIPLVKRLTDPQLRPSFQKADQILRSFVNKDPAQRAQIEKDSSNRGLSPVNPLLEGSNAPDAALVARMLKAEMGYDAASAAAEVTVADAVEAAAEATAAADAAAASSEEDTSWFSEPVDIPANIHERAQMAESEHGAGSYVAYVQGLPAALEQVLGNADLAPRLHEQPASGLVSMVLTNYTMSFDKAARVLRGETEEESEPSIWDLYNKAMETAFWSMLMSFLVLVVMVVVFIRMERHLRVISERAARMN